MLAGRLIGGVLPYVTLLVFVSGVVYRIGRWKRARSTKIPLFPVAPGLAGKWSRIAKEVLVFKGALEGDKSLWIGTWIFHVTLAFILVGHVRVVWDFAPVWSALGIDKNGVDAMSAVLGECAGILLVGMSVYLVSRRLLLARVRVISGFEDYTIIVLILAVALTGNLMRFGSHFDLDQAREYAVGLITLKPASAPGDFRFLWHLLLAQILVMAIPFSKFLHIPGVFFSKSLLYET